MFVGWRGLLFLGNGFGEDCQLRSADGRAVPMSIRMHELLPLWGLSLRSNQPLPSGTRAGARVEPSAPLWGQLHQYGEFDHGAKWILLRQSECPEWQELPQRCEPPLVLISRDL